MIKKIAGLPGDWMGPEPVAMMFRYPFDQVEATERIENAVYDALNVNVHTADIFSAGMQKVSISPTGDAVVSDLKTGN